MNQSDFGKSVPPTSVTVEIARALRREYGEERSAVKTIAKATGANERAVKNWLRGENGPNAKFLVVLCGQSDQVLETVLRLAGRRNYLRAKLFGDAKTTLRKMITLIKELDTD